MIYLPWHLWSQSESVDVVVVVVVVVSVVVIDNSEGDVPNVFSELVPEPDVDSGIAAPNSKPEIPEIPQVGPSIKVSCAPMKFGRFRRDRSDLEGWLCRKDIEDDFFK